MVDTTNQLKDYVKQLKNCFNNDDLLGLRIFIFIITGMCVLWCFIGLAIILFMLTFVQVPAEGLNSFIKNESVSPAVRVTRMILASPVAGVLFVISPFFQATLWLMQFFFNCFAFLTSFGKSSWTTLNLK